MPRLPSPPAVLSFIALTVALTGTSYAAGELGRNSVKSKNVKNGQIKRPDIARNAIDSSKVANGKLRARDFARGELPAGRDGARGPSGARGPAGQQGPAGRSALETLKPGETVRGTIIHTVPVASTGTPGTATVAVSQSLPVPAAESLIEVVVGAGDGQSPCPGSFTKPEAAPGVVCVYPNGVFNVANVKQSGSPTPFGFGLEWRANTGQSTAFQAGWAYTGA